MLVLFSGDEYLLRNCVWKRDNCTLMIRAVGPQEKLNALSHIYFCGRMGFGVKNTCYSSSHPFADNAKELYRPIMQEDYILLNNNSFIPWYPCFNGLIQTKAWSKHRFRRIRARPYYTCLFPKPESLFVVYAALFTYLEITLAGIGHS